MAVNLRLKWIVFILLFMGMLVPGCKESSEKLAQEKKRESIVTATSHVRISHLYFKGVLQPIRNIPVISAIDGIIKRVLFKYGAEVKKGQVLVTVKATGLAEKYRQSVSDFLQKKSAVETAKTKRDGDEQLYKAGVISTEEVTASRNAYATSVLNLAQTRFELEKLLKEVGIRAATIEKLRLGEIKDVAKILVRTFSDLPVHSPASGVVLIPVEQKSSDSGSAQSNKLEQGTTIKTQQRILSLGDLHGYKADVQVSELDIVEIKPGLRAFITGEAFPDIVLQGFVKQVAVQANPSQGGDSGGGLSMFAVSVDVPKVSKKDQKDLRVGMTAKIEIQIKKPPKVMIPIDAVFSKRGEIYVTQVDPKTGQRKNVPVETGPTTENNVVIIEGIKAGDKVVVYHKVQAHDKAR